MQNLLSNRRRFLGGLIGTVPTIMLVVLTVRAARDCVRQAGGGTAQS